MTAVLYATDFSTAADAAMVQAINLARREGAELVIAHVRPDRSMVAEALRGLYDHEAAAAGDTIAAEMRERLARARDAGVDARDVVLEGKPSEALAECAGEIGARTLVVGSLGKTGLERFLLGSTAEVLIRHAPCRVLVARADTGARHGYRSVLAATDFTSAADAALAAAVELAMPDARIELFHVMTPPSAVGVGFGSGPIDPSINNKLRDWVEQSGRRRVERFRDARVQITHSSIFGPVVQSIVDKLDERAFDLVALGSAGRAGIARSMLGSVAERVVRHAPCSALVVPEGSR